MSKRNEELEHYHFTYKQNIAESKRMEYELVKMVIADQRGVNRKQIWQPDNLKIGKKKLREIESNQKAFGIYDSN